MAEKFTKKSRTELLGYVPLERRIASLQISGLRTSVYRDRLAQMGLLPDAKYFDTESEHYVPPVPLPRHMDADLAEVSELGRYYFQKRASIETRIREERKLRVAEARGAGSEEGSQPSSSPPGDTGSPDSAKPKA